MCSTPTCVLLKFLVALMYPVGRTGSGEVSVNFFPQSNQKRNFMWSLSHTRFSHEESWCSHTPEHSLVKSESKRVIHKIFDVWQSLQVTVCAGERLQGTALLSKRTWLRWKYTRLPTTVCSLHLQVRKFSNVFSSIWGWHLSKLPCNF